LGRFRGTADAGVAGLRAAVIVAVAGGLFGGVSCPVLVSAGCGWERFEPLERCVELCDPGPGVLQVELGAPS
jgi:hypothetical protein